MNFPKLTFPLTVEKRGSQYWIDQQGPFKFGEAVTSFFLEDENYRGAEDGHTLQRELELRLQLFAKEFGEHVVLSGTAEEFLLLDEDVTVECTIQYSYQRHGRDFVLVEQYTFSSLRDFLHVDLGKAVLCGNAPRKCRLCGRWFFHEQGDRAIYCDNIAPGEEVKTCREVGARATFERKLQSEEPWKIYKRAYKKYYARVMKGNMSREDFEAWAEQAAEERDRIIPIFSREEKPERRAEVIDIYRAKLNRD